MYKCSRPSNEMGEMRRMACVRLIGGHGDDVVSLGQTEHSLALEPHVLLVLPLHAVRSWLVGALQNVSTYVFLIMHASECAYV